ncbi:MAG: type VII secretion protein EccB [Antricoccus sp.]
MNADPRHDLEVRRYLHREAMGRVLLMGPESTQLARKRQLIGVAITVLLLAAAAGYSLSGRAGTLPRNGVVEADGRYYVVRDSVAHPALNAASALLVGKGQVQPIGTAVIAAKPLGRPIGIVDAPLVLPAKPPKPPKSPREWSICATVPYAALSALTISFLQPSSAQRGAILLARDLRGSLWLLHRNFRFAITEQVAANLGLVNSISPPQVIFDSLVIGPAIVATIADGIGQQPHVPLQFAATVGDVVEVSTGPARYFRVVEDGLIPLTPFAFAAYAPGAPHQLVVAAGGLDHVLPSDIPEQWPVGRFEETMIVVGDAVCVGGLGGLTVRAPTAGVDVAALTYSSLTTVVVPRSGVAVRSEGARSIVSGDGRRYPVVSDDVFRWLGYSDQNVLEVPRVIADLLPIGPTLDPALAMNER